MEKAKQHGYESKDSRNGLDPKSRFQSKANHWNGPGPNSGLHSIHFPPQCPNPIMQKNDPPSGTKGDFWVPRLTSQIREDQRHILTTPVPVRDHNVMTPSTLSHYRIIFGHMPEILSSPKRQPIAGQMVLSPEEFYKFQPKKADPLFPQLGLAVNPTISAPGGGESGHEVPEQKKRGRRPGVKNGKFLLHGKDSRGWSTSRNQLGTQTDSPLARPDGKIDQTTSKRAAPAQNDPVKRPRGRPSKLCTKLNPPPDVPASYRLPAAAASRSPLSFNPTIPSSLPPSRIAHPNQITRVNHQNFQLEFDLPPHGWMPSHEMDETHQRGGGYHSRQPGSLGGIGRIPHADGKHPQGGYFLGLCRLGR